MPDPRPDERLPEPGPATQSLSIPERIRELALTKFLEQSPGHTGSSGRIRDALSDAGDPDGLQLDLAFEPDANEAHKADN